MPAAQSSCFSPRLLLLGLDASTSECLEAALPGEATALTRKIPTDVRSFLAMVKEWRPDVLFCPAGHRHLKEILARASAERLPVVVVTRHPDAREWIEAMDAGAADYVAAPFHRDQIEWVLQSSLLQPSC
jgi:two-component system response regulator FlrC